MMNAHAFLAPGARVALGIAIAAVLLVPARTEAAPTPEAFDAMCRGVAAAAGAESSVTTGVVILDLESGQRCAINGDRPYRSASLYKNVVAAELWRQVAEGLVNLDEPLTVEPRHHMDDAPELRPEEAYTMAVYDAAERMVTFSDNGTALALLERLGLDAVADAPEWLTMPATSLTGTFMTSPNDQAAFFASLYRGEVVDDESSAAILDLLLRQEIVDLIPAGLPEDADVRIAHKTGTLVTFLHDAGIVYAPGGDFVLVVMTQNTSFEDARDAIRSVAGIAYEAYAEPPAAPSTAVPSGVEVSSVAPAAVRPIPVSVAEQADAIADVERTPAVQLRLSEADSRSFVDIVQDPPVLAGAMALLAALAMTPVLLLRRRAASARSVPPGGGPSGGATDDGTVESGAMGGGAGGRIATLGTPAALHYRDSALTPEGARLRADRSERGLVMRFGSRRDDDRPASVSPASRSVSEVAEQPVLPSRRLQRLAEHFRAQGDLLASMRDQFEDEMEPLHELIVKQAQTMHDVLQNLEDRLRPLNEYADGEEANLLALEERIRSGGQDHVARSFSTYLEEQRDRISETRAQIDEQRMPFLEYGDAQRETVEVALARFDSDLDALEENLAEQRRVMVRMLDGMRSETFSAVKDFLGGRQAALAELASQGSTDPAEISQAARQLREGLEALASRSDYVRALLQRAETSDEALAAVAPPAPRPIREEPAPRDDAGEDVVEDEAEVSA